MFLLNLETFYKHHWWEILTQWFCLCNSIESFS